MIEEILYTEKSFDNLMRFLEKESYTKCIILLDNNTLNFCLPILMKSNVSKLIDHKIVIDSGEEHKTMLSCEHIWTELLSVKADRKSVLINLGGGMITDLGGYAASSYKRGIDFINIPTTLVGMIDAAFGGKTGVNFNDLKNQIGQFSLAKQVVLYTPFLNTLPKIEVLSGIGEIMKYALIDQSDLYQKVLNIINYQIENVIIDDCIKIKQQIVNKDYKEYGQRKLLNLGHTVGHALESYFMQSIKMSHGEAVAHGIIIESFIAMEILNLSSTEFEKVLSLYKKFFKNIILSEEDVESIINIMTYDKKNQNEEINFTLLLKIGFPKYNIVVNKDQIKSAFIQFLNI